eukprot:GEMP01002935.1.p1 GENE.GEMP01002935.1~~GEMP01002935.1.p1  ORF type:complete len:635 (+),score=92.31 GEMP01002935.1:991-2895(+)
MRCWLNKYSEVKKSRAFYRSCARKRHTVATDGTTRKFHSISPPPIFSATQSCAMGGFRSNAVIEPERCSSSPVSLRKTETGSPGDASDSEHEDNIPAVDELEKLSNETDDDSKQIVEFETAHYSVFESEGLVVLHVYRTGNCTHVLRVRYRTEDGSAKAGDDYVATEGELIFRARQSMKMISVPIIDDDVHEPEEEFKVVLSDVKCDVTCKIGEIGTTQVTIIDDDEPGILSFEAESMVNRVAHVTAAPNSVALIKVNRELGTTAAVSCKWWCEGGTAIPGVHYLQTEGTLNFLPRETQKFISVPILQAPFDVSFSVICYDARGGASFECLDKTGSRNPSNITDKIMACSVTVKNNQTATDGEEKQHRTFLGDGQVNNNWTLDPSTKNSEECSMPATFKDQFIEALYVNGSSDAQQIAGWFDGALHLFCLPWKLISALVPPASLGGGWYRFAASLLIIAGMTAVMNDVAKLLGCVLGIPDSITAITLVALGTSLPDLFASKIAAQSEPHADTSIGNINGSNAVNVFLGLGISWSMGAIVWGRQGRTKKWRARYKAKITSTAYARGGFVVQSDALLFNVVAFTVGAIMTILIFRYRRRHYGGELGGTRRSKRCTALSLIAIWIAYVVSSSCYVVL